MRAGAIAVRKLCLAPVCADLKARPEQEEERGCPGPRRRCSAPAEVGTALGRAPWSLNPSRLSKT